MNIRLEHLAALEHLGYDSQESQFLYLVATHSGHFTVQQFLDFTQQAKGRPVHRFTQKLIQRRHARVTEYARKTYVLNLYSRRVYGPIDKDNLRNRRRQSKELVHRRLLILDFLLAHPDEPYLETEADKVSYFHDVLGLPLRVLPGRIYKGIRSNRSTKRYFIDRFPIFLPEAKNGLSLPPLVTFVYCDTADPSLTQYVSHLRTYEKFLRRLPAFNFVYASPNRSKFHRAGAFFSRLFGDSGSVDARHLVRYFQLRLLWETNRTGMLSRADRDFLRAGDNRYDGEPFESGYQKWATQRLSDADIDALLGPPENHQTRSFQTYALPHEHNIFETFAA
jgi:hypothetical protein